MTKINIKDLLIITLGIFIVAVAVFFFMMPSNLTVGSVTALAIVLCNFIPLPVSVITLIINLILLLLGFLFIGRDFGRKTVYGAVMLPVFLRLFEVLLPDLQSLTQDALLDTVCYILVVGVGISIMFSRNASSGGIEIVAKLLNKFLGMDLGKAMAVSGMVVALSSAVCYDTKTVVLSVLGTYFGGMIVDHFSFGMNLKRKVCIVSELHDQILGYILNDLKSGASVYQLTGAYAMTPRQEIVVIVDKQEYRSLMDYVRRTDPRAFMTVYAVNEMNYTPKK